MSAATNNTIAIANEEKGTLVAQTDHKGGISLKNTAEDADSIIEGYAATTHKDEANDVFDKKALENMAEKINRDSETSVDVVFPEIDGMEESQIGNINHNNNPAAERMIGAGDTRTVPVFRVEMAEVHLLNDGEHGLFVRGSMLPLPDNVDEAVKGQIREGALHSFSIEFNPINVNFEVVDDEPIRRILDAEPQGVALTGRPMNTEANITDADLKNIMANGADQDEKTNVKTEDTTMTDNEQPDEGNEPEPEDNPEPEPEEGDGEGEGKSDEEGSELKNDVAELKNMFEDIKEENETLREKNSELKSKLEDLKTVEGIKSDIDEIKSMVEESGEDLEGDRPLADQDESRGMKNDSDKPQWKKSIDQLGLNEADLKREIGRKGMTEAESIAETHGVEVQEVMDYVN